MPMASPADVAAALHRFGLERDRFRTTLTRALGIGMADLDAVEHLELAGSLTQRQLGERLLLTSGAVTMLVDRLERAGLVTRGPHASDRRITLVRLVPHPPLAEVPELDHYHAAVRKAAADLPAGERRRMVALLTAVTDQAAAATTSMRDRRQAGPARERPDA